MRKGCYHIGNVMHIISRKRLRGFADTHPDAATPLAAWFKMMTRRRYANGHEVRADFPSVDFLGGSLTVFDVGGNKYRLVVDLRYDLGRVYIRHVLTHREYDRRTKAGTL
jgi:mRNA interferase HigB